MPNTTYPEHTGYPKYFRFGGGPQLQVAKQLWAFYHRYVDLPGVTVKYLCAELSTVASGTQTAEMGLYTSPLAPNGAAQTLSRLTASGTLTDMTTGSPPFTVRTSALSYAIPAGSHVWFVFRCDMSTMPTLREGISHTPLGDTTWLVASNATTALTAAGAATLSPTLPSMASVNHGPPMLWYEED